MFVLPRLAVACAVSLDGLNHALLEHPSASTLCTFVFSRSNRWTNRTQTVEDVNCDPLLHPTMEGASEGPSSTKRKVETSDWKTRRTSKNRIPGVATNDAGQQQLLAALEERKRSRRMHEGKGSGWKEIDECVKRTRNNRLRREKEHPGVEKPRQQEQIPHSEDAKHRASAKALEEKSMLYERLVQGTVENREEFNVDFARKLNADQEPAQRFYLERELQEDRTVQTPASAPSSTKSAGGRSQTHESPSLRPHPKAVSSSAEEDPLQILAKEEELWSTHTKAQHTHDESQNRRRANIKSNFVRTYLAQARASLK